MNTYLKWSLIALAVIISPIIFFFGLGIHYGATNQYAVSSNYHEYTHEGLGIKLLIPNDCTDEFKTSFGMQCKSAVYTYDRGQKTGYLLTVAAKEVSDYVVTNTVDGKPQVTKTLTGEDSWREDMNSSICSIKDMRCYEKSVQGNPAFQTSLFTSDDIGAYNGETLYVYRKSNNTNYAVGVRASDKYIAKLILTQMEKGLTWNK